MTKEHKKLYKAGKNWIAATITVATVAVFGGLATLNAHADSTTQVQKINSSITNQNSTNVTTQGSQINNVNEKQSVNNSKSISQADSYNLTTAGSNNQSSENNNANSQSNMNNGSQTTTASTPGENSDGLDPNIYGTVNAKDWDYQINNNILNLTKYHGEGNFQNGYHIVIPNLNDFNNANINISGIKSVGITSNVLKDIQQKYGSYFQTDVATIAISKTQGAHSDKVVAENSNWDSTFKLPSRETAILEHVDLTNLDTSKITNIGSLFENQSSLREVKGIDTWDTGKITNMKCIFNGTMHLKTIGDLSNWDTSNVTDMSFMFSGTDSIDTVGDLSHWNTSKVTSMRAMFSGTALRSVGDLSHWDTGSVTDMSYMFSGPSSLCSVGDLSNWNTSKVTNMSGMFEDSAIRSAGDLGKWDTSNVTDMSEMFLSMFTNSGLQTVGDLSNWNTSKVTNMSGMFESSAIRSAGDLGKWDTSNVTDMSEMFSSSSTSSSSIYRGLQTVGDLSHWNTSKVTSMRAMFQYSPLHTLDLSNWNTSKVTNMSGMFEDSSLNNVGDISKWDTSNVTYELATMFDRSGLNYFSVSNPGPTTKYNNKIKVMDDLAIMGQTGATIATIKAPTFYKNISGENQAQIVYETVLPLVRKATDEQYKRFYDNLDAKNKKMFPSRILLERVYPEHLSNPSEVANSIFEIKLPEIQNGSINYVDQDGKVIKTDKISGSVGDKINITLALPNGYELANKDEKIPSTIIVGEDGIKPITIQVKKLPVVQTGSINYVDQDGKVIKTDKISGSVGDKINITLALPNGYELANKDEKIPSTIIVGEDGIKPITIQVKKLPVVQTGSINYVDQDGKVIKTDTISGKVGDQINVNLSLPDGYELANKDEQVPSVITVTENGIGTINVNVKKINTTLANNEVPYDSTTISNNVNANYGYLDSYKLTENNQGQAQLIASGWHATGASNSDRYRYMIVFDNTLGHEIARQKLVPQVRSDVQRAYSNVDNSLYSGFNVTIDIPNSCINHSLRLVSRYSNDPNNGEGARVDYWFNSLALNEDNQAYLDKLSANGDTLTVTGWHATNQAAGRPYHYIIAWDRNLGHEIARQKVTAVSRPDVANAYSTVANAVNSGFSVNFRLTPQFFNDNIQFISRWTDDAAGNGNAVDYWFKPINRANRSNLDSVTLSNGQLQVAGWHATDLSQLEPNHYLIVFDNTTGQQVASEKVGLQSSQDVKNAFGDIQAANHSRFNYAFGGLHLVSGHNYSLVSRYSADANGNGNDGAHTDSWLNMGTFQQSAYSIDHVALNRRHMTVQGWVANDNAMTRPYAYAILLQNGHEIGRQRLNLSERADVAKVYPQIYRSQYSGFNTSFDLPTASTNGLQLVLRFTDDPAGNGNSSDKWINM